MAGLDGYARGSTSSNPVPFEQNDTIREELDEFAACVRGEAKPEVGGLGATRSLAVILAGVKSAREGRTVDVDELMDAPDT